MANAKPDGLTDVLDKIEAEIEGDRASVGDVIDVFNDRSFGALITAIGLVAAMPLVGAIPGVSIITGTLIFLVTFQYIVGLNTPWVPSVISARSIDRETLSNGIGKSRPYAQSFDRYLKPRLPFLTGGPVRRRVIAGVVCVLALSMIPLAVIPWGVQAPATAIVLLGVALISRDGVVAVVGFALVAVTAYVLYAYGGRITGMLGM